jgi:uncharacterized protein
MTKKEENIELLNITRVFEMPFNYHEGFNYSRFIKELRDNKKIFGIKCSKCHKVYVPPRVVCRDCFLKMEEFVPVSDEGIIVAFSVINVPYTDPNTGEPKKLPFTAAYIQLDGTDSKILHCLNELDESKIRTGMKVKAVFSDKRTGDYFTDIMYFKLTAS